MPFPPVINPPKTDDSVKSGPKIIRIQYCTISNYSAWPVTRDRRAEILQLHRQRPVGRVTWTNFSIRHAHVFFLHAKISAITEIKLKI